MKVQEVMSRVVKTCKPETNLAAAAVGMWEGDCGVIPVVNDENHAVGLITDRDICIAVATKNRRADEISVGEVIGDHLYFCSPSDDLRQALKTMRESKIRRLPVVDSEGRLQGIISINDIILEAKETKGKKDVPTYEEVLNTLKGICQHRLEAAAA